MKLTMRFISVTYCHTFVSPGVGATVATLFFRRVFIIDDFPDLFSTFHDSSTCSIANNHEICEGVEIRMRYTCVRVSNKADRDLLAI